MCPNCNGVGRVVVTVPCDLYKQGTATAAIRCTWCHGSGKFTAPPATDRKTAAANDN